MALRISFLFLSLKFITLSSIRMDPEDGLSINDNKFNKVDLPDPEGPIRE